MNPTYSPVALIVDDDPIVVKRLSREFLRETSMGVLPAYDLRRAANLLADPSVRIDALVTDLNFAGNTRDDANQLSDGIDLVKFAEHERPEAPAFVVSIEADDQVHRQRAKSLKAKVEGWHMKIPRPGVVPPALSLWATAERACLSNVLRKDPDFRARLKDLKIDVRDLLDDNAIAEKVRGVMKFPRLTYITELGDEFEVLKPIEVMCARVEKNRYSAGAIQIGVLTTGEGENLDEAVKELGQMLVAEAKFLFGETQSPAGFAAIVKKNMREFLQVKTASAR